MAKNIEIKAYAHSFDQQFESALQIADTQPQLLEQRDTFLNSPRGRLKLREFPDQEAQLIYYHRPDQSGPKLSDYQITHTPDADALKATLSEVLGELAVVEKQRTLLMSGRTRLHFDRVLGLGEFIELEVVLTESEDVDSGISEAQELMQILSINEADLVENAYVDLILKSQTSS